MSRTTTALSILASTLALSLVPSVQAAPSEKECAIWLCWMDTSPGACDGPMKASAKRVLKGKKPMPSFSSCSKASAEGEGGPLEGIPPANPLEFRGGFAAVMGGTPPVYRDNVRCYVATDAMESNKPRGCTGNIRYGAVWQDGVQIGETRYY